MYQIILDHVEMLKYLEDDLPTEFKELLEQPVIVEFHQDESPAARALHVSDF